ncbi:MAG: DHHA1 domain-containing protein, partial [Sphingomonadales bacterium]
RLKERYGRPAFVIALDGDVGKGSARSVSGVDLGAAVTAARQAGLLVNGGGHKMAAGLTVERARIPDLEAFLTDRLSGPVAAAREGMALMLDGALTAGAVTPDLVAVLEQAGPYGAGNPQPRFALSRLQVRFADVVGTNHVRCTLEGGDGRRIKAVAFRAADNPLGQLLLSRGGQGVHVAGTVRINRWNGRESAELHIEDAAPA